MFLSLWEGFVTPMFLSLWKGFVTPMFLSLWEGFVTPNYYNQFFCRSGFLIAILN